MASVPNEQSRYTRGYFAHSNSAITPSLEIFYVGLVAIIFGILGKFLFETYKLFNTSLFGDLQKIDLIITVIELVDITMVAQLVWVVALAGVSLFVTTGHAIKPT